MQNSEFLKTGLEAAKKAEDIIMQHYDSGKLDTELKDDMSPVTIADKEAEKIIIETIRSRFPEHSILGEESGRDRNDSEYLWVIDPIDGTKNYMRKIPIFAIEIALMKDGEVIMGVSNAPVLKELLYAEKGKGAYLNGRKITVSGTKELDKAYLCFGGLKHFKKRLDNLIRFSESAMACRGYGDFFGYHLIAQGKIDVMIDCHTNIWDIAAMSIIVDEAGGKFTDIEGNQVTEKIDSALATNGIMHDEVLRILNE
ncbi:MAG: inositol-phosphate phosphatase [Candidatus Aenigmarchaeota archaeon]|nr:inositol-phosphate phosphatase [Candidatus Aenigmarchaeota archaeon]